MHDFSSNQAMPAGRQETPGA